MLDVSDPLKQAMGLTLSNPENGTEENPEITVKRRYKKERL
jgi:hypothetical protein